jgi:crotonobetainyl-CoA:carnitine CoA-transferase CaiB-like acyl-CoA transferase
MSGPLAGLRVLDIATIIAAPFAATLLADYGADVLKIEMPGSGDGVRGFPPFKDGKPLWWKVANRNKKLATLDLRKPEGVELLKRLLPRFDVLIENFRPGTLDKWGLSKEALWAIQPRLVILRATGFGQDGPYAHRPGFARIFEAMGGLTQITGERDGPPMHPGYPIGDAIGGVFGAVASLRRCGNEQSIRMRPARRSTSRLQKRRSGCLTCFPSNTSSSAWFAAASAMTTRTRRRLPSTGRETTTG